MIALFLAAAALAGASHAAERPQPVRVNYALSYCYLAPNDGVSDGQLHVYVWLRNPGTTPQRLPYVLQFLWKTTTAHGWQRWPEKLGANAIGVRAGKAGADNLFLSRPATPLLGCALRPAVKGGIVHVIAMKSPPATG